MRMRTICPLLAAAALFAPAAASAYFPHVVAAGESLTSVAARANTSAIAGLDMTGVSSCGRDHASNSASSGILSEMRTSRYR